MGKKGPLWWRESDWLLRGSSAANQILLRHSGPILSQEILPDSQCRPVYPKQVQLYEFIPSVQVPPCWQGELSHSSISTVEIDELLTNLLRKVNVTQKTSESPNVRGYILALLLSTIIMMMLIRN